MDTDENVVVEEFENALEEQEETGGIEKPRARTKHPKQPRAIARLTRKEWKKQLQEAEVGEHRWRLHNEPTPKRPRGRPRTRQVKEPMPKGFMSEAKKAWHSKR